MNKTIEKHLKEAKPIELNIVSDDEIGKCVFVLKFLNTPTGKVAWHVWNTMDNKQKESTGFLKPIKTPSKILIMPGMSLGVIFPNGEIKEIGNDNDEQLQ